MEIVCEHCYYNWEYSGNLDRATCPNCGKKTSASINEEDIIEKIEEDLEDGEYED